MGYSKEIYVQANKILEQRRQKAMQIASMHKSQVYKACPQILDIERQMAKTGLDAIKTVGAGKNADVTIQNLAKENLKLQQERKELLLAYGFPADFLLPKYTCSLCEDKGLVDGAKCACYEKLLKELAYEKLAAQTPLSLSDFNSFSLQFYSTEKDANGLVPKEEMQAIFEFCKNYAKNFSEKSDSLFLYGKTGLGKTHLSLAIASEVIQKGYGVIYGSAQNLFSKLEKERFGKAIDEDTESLLLDCDLLILDDLGTEFSTGFTVSEIYNIINTRGLRQKPTIINSNLDFSELQRKYSDRITSRILGSYMVLHFCGGDIRIALR